MTYFIEWNSSYVFYVISVILAILIFVLPLIVAPLNYDNEKLSAYECGFNPFETARITFDIQYYLIAILFIIFDIEIIFFVPWVISLKNIGLWGYCIGLLFIIFLTIGFYYEWVKGGLDWKYIFPIFSVSIFDEFVQFIESGLVILLKMFEYIYIIIELISIHI